MNSRLLACLSADYGLNGTLQPLYSYQDRVYVLRTHDGDRFTVKLMHAGCSQDTVALQCAVLRHLESCKHLPVPRVQCTHNSQLYTRFTDDTGAERLVWVVSYIPGAIAAGYQPMDHDALYSMGRSVALLSQSLASFEHPLLSREFEWKLVSADWVARHLRALQKAHGDHAQWLADVLQDFCMRVQPALQDLSWQTVHGDLNDHNVLYSRRGEVCGLLDFGDVHQAPAVCDLAIAAAYFMMHQDRPVQALGDLIRGYHSIRALTADEYTLLYSLIKMRLVQSLTCSFLQRDNPAGIDYHNVSEQPALDLIARLKKHPECFINEYVAVAAGCSRLPEKWTRCRGALADNPPSPVIVAPWQDAEILELDAGSDGPVNPFDGIMTDPFNNSGGTGFFIGRYGEPRLVYQSPLFKSGSHPIDDARTVHAGVDLFAQPGTPVCAPLDGHVHAIDNHTQAQDYGPVIVLRHQLGDDQLFTLYGHLQSTCLEHLQVGDPVRSGQVFCHVGAPPENGDWPPHLHFQCILEDGDWGTDIPGVTYDWSWPVWQRFFPNPAALLNLSEKKLAYPDDDIAVLLKKRRRHLGKNLSVAYARPLKIVRGWQQFLFDQRSRCYLDAYNNVPHVGHCHPRVVDAIARQMRKLATNTRYLHDTIVEYAGELTAQFAAPLDVCFFVNSASEANELALRLARANTGAQDLIVMAGAYHGHTTTLIDISPYKADGPGGQGCPEWVHQVPLADLYRGEFRDSDPNAATGYAQHVRRVIGSLTDHNRPLCGFICESLPSVGGQLVLPEGYLAQVYTAVRAAGGLCIADEVQTGFGRIGDHFWGFEQQGVQPDIVVLGKPMGNGHPLGAVITTASIAATFANGMEFFSTFGGNTVSCAAGREVLRIVQEEQIQQHCKSTGDYLRRLLDETTRGHPLVGDIRGMGLFLGVEMVEDKDSRNPNADAARHVANRLREKGILIGTDGIFDNVLKIRPPAPFNRQDALRLAETLGTVLNDNTLLRQRRIQHTDTVITP